MVNKCPRSWHNCSFLSLLTLSHFFPAEMDPTKKAAFRCKVDEYIRRAEELKDPAAATRSSANDSSAFSQLCKFPSFIFPNSCTSLN